MLRSQTLPCIQLNKERHAACHCQHSSCPMRWPRAAACSPPMTMLHKLCHREWHQSRSNEPMPTRVQGGDDRRLGALIQRHAGGLHQRRPRAGGGDVAKSGLQEWSDEVGEEEHHIATNRLGSAAGQLGSPHSPQTVWSASLDCWRTWLLLEYSRPHFGLLSASSSNSTHSRPRQFSAEMAAQHVSGKGAAPAGKMFQQLQGHVSQPVK